jgi:hypothetical protein|tara:strand:- start:92 stop:292 length:201 start_codon:yes stop_codon:yes gene_type:complete
LFGKCGLYPLSSDNLDAYAKAYSELENPMSSEIALPDSGYRLSHHGFEVADLEGFALLEAGHPVRI